MTRLVALFLLASLLNGWSAELKISNRAAAPNEIGYNPADGIEVELNPPSLTWLHEKGAVKYEVQMSRESSFRDPIANSDLSFNCYTHNRPLEKGRWLWRYRYKNAKGNVSGWSAVRTFKVEAGSIDFPLPNKAERTERLPKAHPRLFVRPETLPALQAAAKTHLSKEFSMLRAQADKLVGAKLVEEPSAPGTASNKTNKMLLQNWWANRVQTVQACTEAETVAFVYLVTQDRKYGAEARRRLLDLAAWDPAKETNFKRNCEAAKPLLHRIARVYDWCYPELSPEDRDIVHKAVRQRIKDAWESGEVGQGTGHINSPQNSHGNRTFHKIGESGIVFLGEIPEAELWLDYALNKFYACYPVWSDSDGGWHEGLSYWAGYMGKMVWWLDAMDVGLGIDGFTKPFFAHVEDFGLYMAPPDSPNMGFGDLSFRASCGSWGSFVEYFNRRAARMDLPNSRYWKWWADSWKMRPADGYLGFLYRARMPALPEPKAPSDLPQSKIFKGIGIASFHTSLRDSKEDVHFLFKSSPFGGASHGFNAQNGFQLNAYGECLLPACCYRDYFGTKFHYGWVHETVSQNAVLVDGKGQKKHHILAQGNILETHIEDAWSYVVGDASAAYEGRLSRALRHAVFIRDSGTIVLLDELKSPSPANYQFMLHGLSPFTLDPEAQTLHLQQPSAGLSVAYLASEPLKLRQWDGFDPAPMKGDFPNHWHVEASTSPKQTSVAVITVLAPHKGAEPPDLQARRIESDTAIGVELKVNGKATTVIFRKAGITGHWRIGNVTGQKAVSVQSM